MRFRTLEIRWHDSKPISTCDFQPVPSLKKARPPPGQEVNFAGQSYRLATGGEDNHVRVWMVHPNIRPSTLSGASSAEDTTPNGPRPPRIEYLATLSRHSAAVNAVRFSPNGELIASAGDDGMIIIWAPSTTPQASTYGSDLSPEDMQHEKEYWKPRTTFRCTTMQVYDLAWSPTGEYIIAGSTDNTARVFAASDGKCVHEIAEHSHYVQGVAWDPLNEYIATQSSDRSMHVYRISTKNGNFEAHAVGKNTRMPHRHSRTPSSHGQSRPRMFRRESNASDAESVVSMSDFAVGSKEREREESSTNGSTSASGNGNGRESSSTAYERTPLTPATSVASTPSASMFPPPPVEKPSSRRSSFSGSNAPGSPGTFSRYGRSPSPMPPLPAIRSLPPSSWSSVKLYGDESFSNFFRRLTFSPDGGLLMTPAGQFEDPSVIPGSARKSAEEPTTPARGRKGRPAGSNSDVLPSSASGSGSAAATTGTTNSSVYIYSRANFARPPIAQLPGHKKASVAVRFSPILYELRQGIEGAYEHEHETKTAALEKGTEGVLEVDVVDPVGVGEAGSSASGLLATPQRTPTHSQSHSHSFSQSSIAAPAPRLALSHSSMSSISASPMLSPMDLRPPTPAASKPSTPVPSHRDSSGAPVATPTSATPAIHTGTVFALPYRMLFAVVTMDTVTIYDTQQAGPVCLLTKLHYDEFTDMTWSPDGQCLMLSSRDGYCTLIIFDEILPAHHTQQHALQLQSIAQHHSVPLSISNATPSSASTLNTPSVTPSSASISLPPSGSMGLPSSASGNVTHPPFTLTPTVPKKRSDPPLTPAASVDGAEAGTSYFPASSSASSSSGNVGHSNTSNLNMDEKEKEKEKEVDHVQEPPKKKRRVALTKVGDLD
ncbi:WD40-repeat-containing domain protein [Crucibulum laeve]|uniref:WD40-repeat-containing domain protein n=1 Tax=Crucibulum laeve TaxID=68775 RepID=A0A5C3LU28_9AGAR|nr:WD40-repeat-containing domain protein [Crucibulum laeve]